MIFQGGGGGGGGFDPLSPPWSAHKSGIKNKPLLYDPLIHVMCEFASFVLKTAIWSGFQQ